MPDAYYSEVVCCVLVSRGALCDQVGGCASARTPTGRAWHSHGGVRGFSRTFCTICLGRPLAPYDSMANLELIKRGDRDRVADEEIATTSVGSAGFPALLIEKGTIGSSD